MRTNTLTASVQPFYNPAVRRADVDPPSVVSRTRSGSKRIASLAILATFVAVDVHAAAPRATMRAFDHLTALQGRIRTLECSVDVTVEDIRESSGTKLFRIHKLIWYSKRLGRVRVEVSSADVTALEPAKPNPLQRSQHRPTGPIIQVSKADGSEPRWLFRIADGVPGAEIREVGKVNPRVIEYRTAAASPAHLLRRVYLDADGLPEKVITFGSREQVLDEMTVYWQSVGGVAFPRESVLVQHSRINTVTTTARYSVTRMNQRLAATLFDHP